MLRRFPEIDWVELSLGKAGADAVQTLHADPQALGVDYYMSELRVLAGSRRLASKSFSIDGGKRTTLRVAIGKSRLRRVAKGRKRPSSADRKQHHGRVVDLRAAARPFPFALRCG